MTDVGQGLAEAILPLIRTIADYPEPGILFRDITPLLADGPAFSRVVDAIVEPYRAGRRPTLDAVVGIEARGFILAAPAAVALGTGFVPIRKRGKLPHNTHCASYDLEYGTAEIEVHVDAVSIGHRVLVVDDVLATGGTAAAACELIERAGAEVVEVCFLMELDALGGASRLEGRSVRSLLHL